jgi:hypothetical protein
VDGLVAQRKELIEKIEAQTAKLSGKLSCVEQDSCRGSVYIIDKFDPFGSAPTVCSKACLGESLDILFRGMLAQLSSYLEGVEKSPDDAAFIDVAPEVKLVFEPDDWGTPSRLEFSTGKLPIGPLLMSCLSLGGNFLPLPELIENFKDTVGKNPIPDLSKQGDLKIVKEAFKITVRADLAKLAHDVMKVIAISREIGKLSQKEL